MGRIWKWRLRKATAASWWALALSSWATQPLWGPLREMPLLFTRVCFLPGHLSPSMCNIPVLANYYIQNKEAYQLLHGLPCPLYLSTELVYRHITGCTSSLPHLLWVRRREAGSPQENRVCTQDTECTFKEQQQSEKFGSSWETKTTDGGSPTEEKGNDTQWDEQDWAKMEGRVLVWRP